MSASERPDNTTSGTASGDVRDSRHWMQIPAPGTFWRDTDTKRVITVTNYLVEPPHHGDRHPFFVLYRYGHKSYEVSSQHALVWSDLYEPATQGDWVMQETSR